MGVGKLNVWIHDSVDPCRINDAGFWFVSVSYCNGSPVEWCGHTYSGETAKCGHAEIELPPGCYVVRGFWFFPPNFRFFTDSAILTLGCDEKACVHLYTPTHRWGMKSVSSATRFLAEKQGVPREKADRLVEALNAVLEHVPKTAQDAALDQLADELPKIIERKPKEERSPDR